MGWVLVEEVVFGGPGGGVCGGYVFCEEFECDGEEECGGGSEEEAGGCGEYVFHVFLW